MLQTYTGISTIPLAFGGKETTQGEPAKSIKVFFERKLCHFPENEDHQIYLICIQLLLMREKDIFFREYFGSVIFLSCYP